MREKEGNKQGNKEASQQTRNRQKHPSANMLNNEILTIPPMKL